MAKNTEIENRFAFHPYADAGVNQGTLAMLHEAYGALAEKIDTLVPDSREKATALTNLEQSLFWAKEGITRN